MLSQTSVWSDEEYSNFCIVQIAELTQADLKGMNNSIISVYNVGIVEIVDIVGVVNIFEIALYS